MTPDWTSIAAAISAATRQAFAPASICPVGGGSIHAAWRVGDGRREYFVKTGNFAAEAMFIAEAAGLAALAAANALRTPRPVAHGTTEHGAYLAMEALDIQPLSSAGGARLGAALARLHRASRDDYGGSEDNFIGATPQSNAAHPSWPHFFADRRLRPQLLRAQANGMDRALIAKGMSVAERVGALFLDYRPLPSLLHGDLWSGNAGQLPDGDPVLFDPASYWGDRETDIAMAELFGGFPTSFFAAYRAAWPLHGDYERRKPLYNLYHVLNHYNLFGSAYLGQAQRMIDKLLTDLRR